MPGEIIHGRDFDELDESCDVVIVGSGAGGAIVATHLAEAGRRVIVLEEGPHYTPDEIREFRPTEAMRKMWREGGFLVAIGVGDTPMIGVTVGRNVGGSSVHTGGVSFRIPSGIHHEWVRDLGLHDLSERALEGAYEDVEKRVHVVEIQPSERSLSTNKFVDGAAKLGVPMHPIRRNTIDCEGNGLCNFGCPKGAKMSVDVSYLPSAIKHGATIVSDALVTRVLFDGDRAIGVEGTLASSGIASAKPRGKFRIRANVVVLACGTLHTPLLLGKSGVRSEHLGEHITLHPSMRLLAKFKDRVNGWDGALQSVYSDHFHEEGITLVGVYTAVNVLAAGMPGVGPAHRQLIRDLPYMGVFGGLVHDDGNGSIRPAPGAREGILTYRMSPRDLWRVKRSMQILGEIAFAGGAEEIYVPIFGVPAIRDMATLKRVTEEPFDARRMESIAFHPLGSARMANDARRGVTSERGEVFGTRGLYVADGSSLPTSVGVNTQLPIMAMATRIAWLLRDNAFPRAVSSQKSAQEERMHA